MKILHLDIENAPHNADVWSLWNDNIPLAMLRESGYTMCFAARWEGQKKTHFRSVHHHGTDAMLDHAWSLMDEADAIVTYNGTRHDIPILHKEFVLHGMPPPSKHKDIDLLKTVKKQFRFPSNKLEYVANALGVGMKHKHEGYSLWAKCMAGVPSAWKEMKEYNITDIDIMQDVYHALLPWIDNHPNQGLYVDPTEPTCRNCGSTKLIKNGHDYTFTMKYQRYRCSSCGKNLRARKGEPSNGHVLL